MMGVLRLPSFLLLLPLGILLATSGCTVQAEANAEGDDKEVELAVLMGELQRHSTKLGLAIRGEKAPLANFYLDEVTEVLTEVYQVHAEEGMPIGKPAEVIMNPLVEELRGHLTATSWANGATGFQNLINGCNRCHVATEHGFIEILTAPGESGFAQRF